jgi:hypothetical protein
VAKNTSPGTPIVTAVTDDAQLAQLTAISAFGDSIPPRIITKKQIHENHLAEEYKLYEGNDYVM